MIVAKEVRKDYIAQMNGQIPNARDIAQRGNSIYRRKYSTIFDPKWRGRFAAIDIDSEQAYVADYPEEALSNAKKSAPSGIFYLVKIGSMGAFKTARLVPNANPRFF